MKKIAVIILSCFLFNFILQPIGFAASPEDSWDSTDKAWHFGLSAVGSVAAYNFYRKVSDFNDSKARWTAFWTVLAIGVIKEAADRKFGWKDLAADGLGAGLGAAISVEF